MKKFAMMMLAAVSAVVLGAAEIDVNGAFKVSKPGATLPDGWVVNNGPKPVGKHEIIQKDGVCENLDLIAAGPTAPNPSELLLSERLEELIAVLREQYDYIFIDNVPVGIIADAAITNRVADLTIFVVRVGKLDRRMLPELEKIYRSGQLNNMSLILNGAITNKVGYGGYGYGYGYGYGGYEKEEKKGWKSIFKK